MKENLKTTKERKPKTSGKSNSIETVQKLADICDRFRLDLIEVDGIRIVKSRHLPFSDKELQVIQPQGPANPDDPELDLRFYSAEE